MVLNLIPWNPVYGQDQDQGQQQGKQGQAAGPGASAPALGAFGAPAPGASAPGASGAPAPGLGFRAPDRADVAEFQRVIRIMYGVQCTIRQEKGQVGAPWCGWWAWQKAALWQACAVHVTVPSCTVAGMCCARDCPLMCA